MYQKGARAWNFVCGVCTSKEVVDCDYSYYLGPDYKSKYKKIVATSTYVSNHVSWIDTMTLYQHYKMALSLDYGFKNVPIMGKMSKLIDSIYLPRGKTEEKRKEAIQTIVDR